MAIINYLQAYFAGYNKEFQKVLKKVKAQHKAHDAEDDNWSLFQQALRIVQVCGKKLAEYHKGNTDSALVSILFMR